MEKFYCPDCQKIFEAEGKKKEWQSSVFGPCWKIFAQCPVCHKECQEYRPSGLTQKGNSCSGKTCSLCRGCA
mgnify:CR=1 FL=1